MLCTRCMQLNLSIKDTPGPEKETVLNQDTIHDIENVQIFNRLPQKLKTPPFKIFRTFLAPKCV